MTRGRVQVLVYSCTQLIHSGVAVDTGERIHGRLSIAVRLWMCYCDPCTRVHEKREFTRHAIKLIVKKNQTIIATQGPV
jgi:hypothetical protein